MRNSEFHKAPYWLRGMIAETNALRRENERMVEEIANLREQNNKLKELDVSQLIRKSIKPQYIDLFESFIK